MRRQTSFEPISTRCIALSLGLDQRRRVKRPSGRSPIGCSTGLATAQGALGQHWGERTPAERAEFVRLFGDVFEHAYRSKIQLADAKRFAYLGDSVEGDHTVVRTRIATNNGTVITVNYRVRMTEGGPWRVYDLDVGGVSLVNNYRTQFNSIIASSSYTELVKRLKALRDQRGGVRWATPPLSA
ncbi:MAG: MlaC/ttg2D family ABC transporter substrate-binding protein [Candidatus Limnocylindria bacterium]